MTDKCSILCDFCDALRDEKDIGRTLSFKKIINHGSQSRTILESENFVVIAGLGPLTPGYLLLLTKKHYLSMAEIEVDMYYELQEVYTQVMDLLKSNFSNAIVFEHGPMVVKDNLFSGYGGGSCMDHAHLHFVPTSDDFFINEIKHDLPFIGISNISDLKNQYDRKIPYLFIQDLQGDKYIFDAPEIESQYMRKKIAKSISKTEEWNWRTSPNIDELLNTINILNKQKIYIGK